MVKTSEFEMAQFLECLKAPQSRRIVECLQDNPLNLSELLKKSKLSKRSIELHLEPLLEAKLVVRKTINRKVLISLNKSRFKKNSEWFVKLQIK